MFVDYTNMESSGASRAHIISKQYDAIDNLEKKYIPWQAFVRTSQGLS